MTEIKSVQYCPDSSSGFKYNSDTDYCYLGVDQSYTWLEAEYYCQQFTSGHLARVDGNFNSWFVSNFPSINANRWIGYTRLFFSGITSGWNIDEYVWIDGISSSYTNWASSEPSNVATENCVQFYATDGLWNDQGCHYQYSSVCRMSATSGACSGSFVYESSTGYCYMYVSTLKSWNAAQSNCELFSANLATVSSSTENIILKSYGSDLWIGFNTKYYTGTSSTHSDQFVWVDGSSITYTNWKSGEPDNCCSYSSVNEEFCTKMNSIGEWYGENCWSQYNFICEQPYLTLTYIPTLNPTNQPSPHPSSLSSPLPSANPSSSPSSVPSTIPS
eukprot:gene14866-19983_t